MRDREGGKPGAVHVIKLMEWRSIAIGRFVRSASPATTACRKLRILSRNRSAVSCHMPGLATEYAHVAVTDHRILRRPATHPEGVQGKAKVLTAWVDPPAEFRQRDLVLANLTAGHRLSEPGLRLTSLKLLDQLPNTRRENDSPLLAAACEAMLDQKLPQKGIAFCRRAAELEPESADRAMFLGIALHRSGESEMPNSSSRTRFASTLHSSMPMSSCGLFTIAK